MSDIRSQQTFNSVRKSALCQERTLPNTLVTFTDLRVLHSNRRI